MNLNRTAWTGGRRAGPSGAATRFCAQHNRRDRGSQKTRRRARSLRTINPSRIEQTSQTLVGFGTRSTLSSMEADLPPGQGSNAAADWMAAPQFDAVSKQCGGCLEVRRDLFLAEPSAGGPWAGRIAKPTRLVRDWGNQSAVC